MFNMSRTHTKILNCKTQLKNKGFQLCFLKLSLWMKTLFKYIFFLIFPARLPECKWESVEKLLL